MKLRRLAKWAAAAVVVIGIAIAGVRWWSARTDAAANAADEDGTTTATATVGPLSQLVQCTGTVQSNLDVDIKCRASGPVVKLPFDVSDHVKKGDLLVQLDPADTQRIVEQSKASLAASQARLAQSVAALAVAKETVKADRLKADAAVQAAQQHVADTAAKAKREQQLLKRKFSSPELVETAQTAAVQAQEDLKSAQAQMDSVNAEQLDLETKEQDIKLNQAQVDSDKIAMDLAKLQLSYTSVYAPMDGVVSARNVQIGTIIASGINNVGGGTTVMTLSDLSHIFVYASVDESDIGFVKLNQSADITADSYPGKDFTGKVIRIAPKGVSVSNVVTFEVRIEVTSKDKTLLKPEMTANVNILVADKSSVLQVPTMAIIRRRDGNYVAVKAPGESLPELYPVKIGISDGEQTEIVSGIKKGTTVLVQSPEANSRWEAAALKRKSARNKRRGRYIMMRTMGGGRHH